MGLPTALPPLDQEGQGSGHPAALRPGVHAHYDACSSNVSGDGGNSADRQAVAVRACAEESSGIPVPLFHSSNRAGNLCTIGNDQ